MAQRQTQSRTENTMVDEGATEVGRRVRAARRARGLTQRALAQKAKVGRDSLVKLERGQRRSRPSTLRKIAKALDIPFRELVEAGVYQSVRPIVVGQAPPEAPSRHAVVRTEGTEERGALVSRRSEFSPDVLRGLFERPDPEDVEALLETAKRRAASEGISEDEAIGRLYREYVLFARVASHRRFGLPREERPVMSRPEASTEALSAVAGD